MKNIIIRSFKLAIAGLALLVATSQAQAAVMPSADLDFGPVGTGVYSSAMMIPASAPSVLWFGFTLNSTSLVNLNTLGSPPPGTSESPTDTVLALYNSTGALLGQNDDCGTSLLSCLQFDSLESGDYLAGVSGFPGVFIEDWMLNPAGSGGKNIVLELTVRELSVSAVPVPAAIWLFGSALVGFVGMSRRTSVKS